MTQKENRLKRKEILEQRLANRYENIMINGKVCFLLSNGVVCRLDSMGDTYDALVIEYADDLKLAKKNVFGEDGDLFYMDKFDEDKMYQAMVKEIEEFL